jgi:beta-galactosidase
VKSKRPLTFEDLNQPYGFVLYRAKLRNVKSGTLKIKELRDYGLVFVNGVRAGILDRRLAQDSLYLEMPSSGNITLEILVENLGRINFGPYLLKNTKGITERVTLNDDEVLNWEMFSLPLDNASDILFAGRKGRADTPTFKKATILLDKTADTYLDFQTWGKGVVWINGHNLGRYWSIGPQQTVYVPAEWLKAGKNEIVVFELLDGGQEKLSFSAEPILDRLKAPKFTKQ